MNFFKRILVLLVNVNLANAGGWVVGGGELIGDAGNPWFLQNVKTVNYCVKLDEANFGLSPIKVRQAIQRGFAFWERQFEKQKNSANFLIGRQDFEEVSCVQQHDITFQFGVLELDQLTKLKDIDRKVAFTVRTDYDRINMKGKGFVYLSPEEGPLKVKNTQVADKPWSRTSGLLTEAVLIHEMGHIFGFKHDPSNNIMYEGYVEDLVTDIHLISDERNLVQLNKYLDLIYLFELDRNSTGGYNMGYCFFEAYPIFPTPKKPKKNITNVSNEIVSQSVLLKRFFSLQQDVSCYRLDYGVENGKRYLEIIFTASDSNVTSKVKIYEDDSVSPQIQTKPLFTIFLPPESHLFNETQQEYLSFGEGQTALSFKTTIDNGINIFPSIITLFPNRNPTITTFYEGKIYFDILRGY